MPALPAAASQSHGHLVHRLMQLSLRCWLATLLLPVALQLRLRLRVAAELQIQPHPEQLRQLTHCLHPAAAEGRVARATAAQH